MNWQEANRHDLMAALADVKAALLRAAGQPPCSLERAGPVAAAADAEGGPEERAPASASATEELCRIFDLTPFERDLLLLCAGPELDGEFVDLLAHLQGSAERAFPTFGLALAVLPRAHWTAILPNAPLRYWRMIEVGAGEVLTRSPLRIDERILHFLAGVHAPDERLASLLHRQRAEDVAGALSPTHRRLAERIAASLLNSRSDSPAVCLSGSDSQCVTAVAAQVCAELGLELHLLRAEDIPAAASERSALVRLWNREAVLGGGALLVDLKDEAGPVLAPLAALVDELGSPLFVGSRLPLAIQARRPLLHFAIDKPPAGEQAALWTQRLAEHGIALNGFVPALVSQFNLPQSAIGAACAEALAPAQDEPIRASTEPIRASTVRERSDAQTQALQRRLWEACRTQARPRLDDVAQRVHSSANWDDLVLAEAQLEMLREIVAHVRQRHRVYEEWGFAARSQRGLGTGVVFAGPSGTGKTLAAEIMAHELHLDLYRIDLSAVVSKYIGETEKNLRRIFDAAEYGGAILLFDEADALFGKRSEVKDSHDRYANIEVSFLLQQMETYRGLAILTTNQLSAFDSAFLRRIRFIVHFAAPSPVERAQIWARIFPPATPTAGLDVRKLARLNITGGNIRNIALNAAFLAADAGEPVGMAHLLRAARVEYAKLEKPLTAAEVRDWVASAPKRRGEGTDREGATDGA